jgi:hypothetical protein
MSVLTTLLLAGTVLLAPADEPCPPDGEPYSAIADYACSLAAWHRSTQGEPSPADPPSCRPAG